MRAEARRHRSEGQFRRGEVADRRRRQGGSDNPADALALAESLRNRQDVSAEDRAAALKAQQDALKKLSESAASGDAKAQEAIDKYRASK